MCIFSFHYYSQSKLTKLDCFPKITERLKGTAKVVIYNILTSLFPVLSTMIRLSWLKLPWTNWYCREWNLNCREQIEIAVNKLKLPWLFWATAHSRPTADSPPKGSRFKSANKLFSNFIRHSFSSVFRKYHRLSLLSAHKIDGFHSDVIKLQRQKSEVLRILIYTRLKINRK